MAFAGYISESIFDGGLDAQSYLYTLPVVQYLSAHRRLRLSSNVTFLSEKTERANLPCWKPLPLPMGLTRRAVLSIFAFPQKQPIPFFGSI